MKIKVNNDVELVAEIRQRLKENDYYCPCMTLKSEDTKCMCADFMRDDYFGLCHCGLYFKER